MLVGLAIRMYFVVFTEGTYDVNIWQHHAAGVHKDGLINYYHANQEMNHPPFISIVLTWLWSAAQASGIPFRVLLRAPFALLDAGTALLLLHAFRDSRYRFVIMACYWLHPLAMIFSAYHGNTDSSVAFFLMLCVYLLVKGEVVWAGAVLGMSLWIKLPGMLAIPALLCFLPCWRVQLKFLVVVGLVGLFTYLPVLFSDPGILYKNVFGYRGQIIHTTAGIPVWGMQILLAYLSQVFLQGQTWLYQPVSFFLKHNMWFCVVPIVLLGWLRRSEKTVGGLGRTVAGLYTILYGFSNFWSFQYFAWSIPFWFFVGSRFAVPATLLAGGYIYALYWVVCGNPWLLGEWDFVGHPYWAEFLRLFRDFTVLFFFLSAWMFLIDGICEEFARRRGWRYRRTSRR